MPGTLTFRGDLATAARDLDEDTLARRRKIHGDDRPWALITASNLAEPGFWRLTRSGAPSDGLGRAVSEILAWSGPIAASAGF